MITITSENAWKDKFWEKVRSMGLDVTNKLDVTYKLQAHVDTQLVWLWLMKIPTQYKPMMELGKGSKKKYGEKYGLLPKYGEKYGLLPKWSKMA